MKKLFYLMAMIAVVFTACDPLSQTYKSLDALPKTPGLISVTLTNTYKSSSDANSAIPSVLLSRFPNAINSTSASVTFSLANSSSNISTPDSAYTSVASTLVAADYTFPASTLPNGTPIAANSSAFFTSDAAINYLYTKYPTPVPNQLVVLTYLYSETGVTPAGGATVTDAFVYFGSGWAKLYTINAAQYASTGRGTNNYFLATGAEVTALPGILNTLVKSDPLAMGTASVGTTKYVSYRAINASSTIYQKVMTLTYDGANWLPKQTLPFLKLNGTWVPDPTVYVTFPTIAVSGSNQDYNYLVTLTGIASSDALASLAQYGDFDIRGSSKAFWTSDQINAALAALLLHKYPKAIIGVPYSATYYTFLANPVTKASKVFVFNGTAFVLQQ